MNSRPLTAGLLAAIAVVMVLPLGGCGYGRMSSTGYEYAKALYSLSNRQSAHRVDDVQLQIDAAAESGELPDQEAQWLRAICDDCRDGNWDSAQCDARRMMEDQVEY